jgi:hypothetical protein
VDVSADLRLGGHVVDNLNKFESTGSETSIIGHGFGITLHDEQGVDGNTYIVSVTDGVAYRISRR